MKTRWAIATPHTAATEAGLAAFRDGGNAIDAALAAACVLAVVYPHMCSVGGDALALARTGDGGEIHAVNGSGRAARDLPGDLLHDGIPTTGPLTITVPGALAAWETLASRWGSRPLGAALEQASALARNGVAVARSLADSIAEQADVVAGDAGLSDIFMPGGTPLTEGDRFFQPALAETLAELASDGTATFYSGDVGRTLIEGLRGLGSPLSSEDLSVHGTDVGFPISRSFRGNEIVTMGPNSQGLVLLQILMALEQLDLEDPLGSDAPVLADLFRATARDRDSHIADPAISEVPVDRLLSEGHIAELASSLEPARMRRPGRSSASGDTVALVTADAEGNAVSLIQSLFHGFGSGILEPRTGIICHNRGACFSSDPGSPNVIAPGKRPLHTLMPVMLRRDGRLLGVAGTMGGRQQPQIHTQVLLRLLGGDSPAEAISGPRFVVGDDLGLSDGTDVCVEEDAPAALGAFGAAGVPRAVAGHHDETTGHANLIVVARDGSFEAATDPRADGSAAAG